MHEIDYVLLLRLDYMFCQSFELCLGYFISICLILESPYYFRYNADFSFELMKMNIFVNFWKYISLQIFMKMSPGNSQRRVRQRTDEGLAANMARMEGKQVIPERT
jgi:hypothetical protein